MNYAMIEASQGGIVFRGAFSAEAISMSTLSDYKFAFIPFQALTENRPPIVAPAMRPSFKQRTFPGKPLSDEDVIHANRIATKIEDDQITGRFDE